MPNKEFLEEYPLFRRLKTQLPVTLNKFPKPPINMHCAICGSIQTFNMVNEYHEFFEYVNAPANDVKVRLEYLCQSCRKYTRQFQIYLSPNLDYCYKFGQYPEWEIKIEKNLENSLGKHAKIFKKGLVCESQGYGIGAFAYYRRITENIIDELLDSIADLIDSDKKEQYIIALEKTKATRVTQEKIDLIKDLLPSILRPNGMNPLGVLHSELSEGLHSQEDEQCLEISTHIRDILTFLLDQILLSKQTAQKFTSSMKSLLDKRSSKN
jgi:hypothetical protein